MTILPYFPVVATCTLIMTVASAAMSVITPEVADAYSFKAFLIICVIGLSSVILMGFKMWYKDMSNSRQEMVKALHGNTEAIARLIELFDNIGAEAMMKSLRPDDQHHSDEHLLYPHKKQTK